MKSQSQKNPLIFLFYGICMGAADIVPGVSGGTIAFLMGFYEDLIQNIKRIGSREKPQLNFLLPLGAGILLALLSFSHLIHFILETPSYRTLLYAVFIGLILDTALICAKRMDKWKPRHAVVFALGLLTAFVLSGGGTKESSGRFDVSIEREYSQKASNYDSDSNRMTNVTEPMLSLMLAKGVIEEGTAVYDRMTGKEGTAREFAKDPQASMFDIWLIFCGVLAVCAMLLPGISGSYLMVILGMYPVIIEALANLFSDLDSFFILLNLSIGIVFGGLFFSRAISWLLSRHHDLAIALLTGFMLGAMRALWPFWSYVYRLHPLKLDQGPQLETLDPILPSLYHPLTLLAFFFSLAAFFFVIKLEKKLKQI